MAGVDLLTLGLSVLKCCLLCSSSLSNQLHFLFDNDTFCDNLKLRVIKILMSILDTKYCYDNCGDDDNDYGNNNNKNKYNDN